MTSVFAPSIVTRRPAAAYFVLAYAMTWVLLPLVRVSPLFGLPGLFGPAIAALMVTAATEGRTGTRNLLGRVGRWRVGILPYVLAFGIPIGIAFGVAAVGSLARGDLAVHLSPVTPITAVLFVLVVGEEVGWRGYAQPALAERFGAIPAALVVGVLWALWHLPLFYMEGMPQREVPLAAFVVFTMAFSVVAAWLLANSRESLLIATLLHGSFNAFTFLTPALDTSARWWLVALAWSIAAVAAGSAIRRRQAGGAGRAR